MSFMLSFKTSSRGKCVLLRRAKSINVLIFLSTGAYLLTYYAVLSFKNFFNATSNVLYLSQSLFIPKKTKKNSPIVFDIY